MNNAEWISEVHPFRVDFFIEEAGKIWYTIYNVDYTGGTVMARLIFATPDNWEKVKDFGCATQKFAGAWQDPSAYEHDLQGQVLTGTYDEILKAAAEIKKADVAIVFFGNAGGENGFLHSLQEILGCPMVGGGAAFTVKPGLVTGGGEAAVLVVDDDRYNFETETQCVHHELLDECTLVLEDPRTILTINGQDAVSYLKEKKAAFGIPETDFEHITLTDGMGVNAHLSLADGKIKSGRDLHTTMQLRRVPHETVSEAVRAFYDDKDAIVFGCAGLGGILDEIPQTPSLGLFLFGEVCTVNGKAEFGNLMLSKLRIRKK